MIISEYAKYLQLHNDVLLTHRISALELLHKWIYKVINKNPKNNAEKIIHKEILYAKNNQNDYIILGKSESGRKLLTALINFASSYENYNKAKWLELTEQSFHSKDCSNDKNMLE